MKGIKVFVLALFCISCCNVCIATENGGEGPLRVTDDIFVAKGQTLDVAEMDISGTILLVNEGSIHINKLVVDSDCTLSVQNKGDFDATVELSNNSGIVQIVKSNDDLVPLNINSNFKILIEQAEKISLHDLLKIAKNVNEISLDHSSIVLDGEFAPDSLPKITSVGDYGITVYVNSIKNLQARFILPNVEGMGTIRIKTDNTNPLFVLESYLDKDEENLYISFVRETDYFKILKNNTGKFLNYIRKAKPNDKLLTVLDNVKDMRSLGSILGKTAKLNHINFMNPIRTFNTFEKFEITNNDIGNLVSLTPNYIFSNDFYSYGIQGKIGFSLTDKLAAFASVYFDVLNYSDELDEYKADIYGGNVLLKYENDLFLSRNMLGLSIASFNSGAIFDGKNILHNPIGTSIYAVTDFGVKVFKKFGFSILPFIGLASNYSEIVKSSNLKADIDLGADVYLDTEIIDIAYNYGMEFRTNTRGEIGLGLKAKFFSLWDGAGADLGFGFIYDENHNTSFQTRLSGKMEF